MIQNDLKERFNDIVLSKDVKKFRTFISDHREHLTKDLVDKLLCMTTPELLSIMTYWGATQPVFAPYWEKNRGILRGAALEQEFALASDELKSYIRDNAGRYPNCLECRWFRSAPPNEKEPCANLGAIPTDIACAGWTPIGASDDLQGPHTGSGQETANSV